MRVGSGPGTQTPETVTDVSAVAAPDQVGNNMTAKFEGMRETLKTESLFLYGE